MKTYTQAFPDIELTDDYGKVQFYNITIRQYQVLNKFKQIQELLKNTDNNEELGIKVRKILQKEN